MTRRFPAPILLVPLVLAAVGCRSHSIKEGIWQLRFDAQDYAEEEPVDVPSQRVRLSIEWSQDRSGEAVEVVQIERLESEARPELRRMYATIDAGQRFIVNQQTDEYWVYRLVGKVLDEEHVSGTDFMAKSRFEEGTYLVGRWDLEYLTDD